MKSQAPNWEWALERADVLIDVGGQRHWALLTPDTLVVNRRLTLREWVAVRLLGRPDPRILTLDGDGSEDSPWTIRFPGKAIRT